VQDNPFGAQGYDYNNSDDLQALQGINEHPAVSAAGTGATEIPGTRREGASGLNQRST
jgi:hypothetical protein